ncbi:hypothetical protein EYC84_008815 [Monilinia fructicola]|uniref:Uncharacterized protein n=1 Tax=Monilinia fructicola TaxID=38448 RepID=A0A5M9J9Z8_MONFR|nr:hypothetical protein EYC84_008815 [Monilinia fructicola]
MDWSTGPIDPFELAQEKPINIMADLDVGGGAYRLEFLQDYIGSPGPDKDISFQILASCMEVGAKILEVQRKDSVWNVQVIASIDIENPAISKSNQQIPIMLRKRSTACY